MRLLAGRGVDQNDRFAWQRQCLTVRRERKCWEQPTIGNEGLWQSAKRFPCRQIPNNNAPMLTVVRDFNGVKSPAIARYRQPTEVRFSTFQPLAFLTIAHIPHDDYPVRARGGDSPLVIRREDSPENAE